LILGNTVGATCAQSNLFSQFLLRHLPMAAYPFDFLASCHGFAPLQAVIASTDFPWARLFVFILPYLFPFYKEIVTNLRNILTFAFLRIIIFLSNLRKFS